jgi:hypothetical protein
MASALLRILCSVIPAAGHQCPVSKAWNKGRVVTCLACLQELKSGAHRISDCALSCITFAFVLYVRMCRSRNNKRVCCSVGS